MPNELGIEHEHVPMHYRDGGTQTPEFLALDPNAQVPVLIDGDLRLWESLAIVAARG
jgi:glutathione S-transferase